MDHQNIDVGRVTNIQDQLQNVNVASSDLLATPEEVKRRLYALKKAAAQEPQLRSNGISEANTMPYIIDAVRAYATVGEICEALREVYGTYTEVSVT